MSVLRVILFSSIVLSSVSGMALGQPAGPASGGPAPGQGRWDPSEMRAHAEARRAEHAKALHDILGIQPGQEAAFAAFTASMRPPEGSHDGDDGRDGRRGPSDESRVALTTPQRLDRMKAEMDRRFAAMRDDFDRRASATRTLYASLDPRQRAAMDALPELTGHGGGRGRMGHMDYMGPPGPTGSGM